MSIDAQEWARLLIAWEERRRQAPQRIQSGMPRNPERQAGPPTMNRNRSRREVLESRERRNVMSTAHTFGRMHASLYYLINTNATDSSVAALRTQQERTRELSSAEVNLELLAEMLEGNIQFAQARQEGLITRHASGAWVSVIPRMPNLVDISSRVSWFADEFDDAVEAQHRDHFRATINECLLTIATELTFWGLGRVVRLVRISASASRSSRDIVNLFRSAKLRMIDTPAQIIRAAEDLARRLTRGRRGVPISLCPRTGQTLQGVGPPQNIGRAQTLPQDIGRAQTLPQNISRAQTLPQDIGRAPTLPQNIGRAPTLPTGGGTQARNVRPSSGPAPVPQQSTPSSQGRIQGPGNIEIELLTADDAREVTDFIRDGGLPASMTFGTSRVVLESYAAKWTQYGMRGTPPPHGFRVWEGRTLRDVVAHFTEPPPIR